MTAITIDRLAFGGSGFGRLDGKACFVPYTAPGDSAEIRITRDKSSYCEGVLTALKIPSAVRVPPLCPVFGVCGGCDWQHITYEEQCRQKEQLLADTLWRAARLDAAKIRPLLRADSPFAYRQRIQLKVDSSAGSLAIGFHRPGTHSVVDVADNCPLVQPAINRALAEVRGLLLLSGEAAQVTQVDLIASPEGQVVAIFHYGGHDQQRFARLLADRKGELAFLHGINIRSGKKSPLQHLFGPQQMSYALPASSGPGLEINYSAEGFSQVNFSQNRAIVQTLLDFTATISCGSILDLFCGNGNFSLPLARSAEKVVGFEAYAKSVQLAGKNASQNGITNTSYRCLDSAAGLVKLAAGGDYFDLVIIDPPRSGAADVARNLHKSRAAHLIYISCDPPTLARDLNILQNTGYQVLHVQPVDMFPQTYHLESIVFLQSTH